MPAFRITQAEFYWQHCLCVYSISYFKRILIFHFHPFIPDRPPQFIPRDLDMFMLERERAAVSAWEAGAEQFYVMRDTPQARNRAGILMPIKVGTLGLSSLLQLSTNLRSVSVPGEGPSQKRQIGMLLCKSYITDGWLNKSLLTKPSVCYDL